MSPNPYDPPGGSPPPPPSPSSPYPMLATMVHLAFIFVLVLVMIWKIEDPEYLIAVAIWGGFWLAFPFFLSLVGAAVANLISRHRFVDQYRRYLALFLTGMLVFDLLFIWAFLTTNR